MQQVKEGLLRQQITLLKDKNALLSRDLELSRSFNKKTMMQNKKSKTRISNLKHDIADEKVTIKKLKAEKKFRQNAEKNKAAIVRSRVSPPLVQIQSINSDNNSVRLLPVRDGTPVKSYILSGVGENRRGIEHPSREYRVKDVVAFDGGRFPSGFKRNLKVASG